MAVSLLAPDDIARLRAAPYSYAAVGATAGAMPAGFRPFTRSCLLARRDFDAAAEDLMRWRVHEHAGLRVASSSPRIAEGAVVSLRLLGLTAACRVVYVVDDPRRKGFAYGTLPGHPESGEELFLLTQRETGEIEFAITAFSRPASRLARVGGPVARLLQQTVTSRYLEALDRMPTRA